MNTKNLFQSTGQFLVQVSFILLLLGHRRAVAADLTDLSLEELVNIEITTHARKEQNLFEASAAVYVITGEELRRTGVRALPMRSGSCRGFLSPMSMPTNGWLLHEDLPVYLLTNCSFS